MAYPQPQPDPTAVFGRRVVAFLLDMVLIVLPIVIIASGDFEYLTTETLENQGTSGEDFCEAMNDRGDVCVPLTDVDGVEAAYFSEGWSGTTRAAFWLIPLAYLVVLQGFTGWTLGKLATGIRTVREDGRPAGLVKALVRWLLWIVDGFPYFMPLVGFIVGLTTTGHRRVGDMAAKTFVVRKADAGSPVIVPGLTATSLAAGAPWGTPPPTSAGAPWGTPPPTVGAPGGWPAPERAEAPGWASPTPAPPPAAAPPPAPVPAEGPQWDQARGTYIQWDPQQRAWMQWDEGSKVWSRIPGQ